MAFVGKVGHRAALSDRTDGQEHREPVLEHPEPVQELSKQRFKVGMLTTKSLVTENFSHHTSYLKSCSFIRFFCDTVMNFFSYFLLFVGPRRSFHGFQMFLVFPEHVFFKPFQTQQSGSLLVHHITWFSPEKLVG